MVTELEKRGVQRLFVEGGAQVLRMFLDEGMADTLSVGLPTLLNDATTAVKRLDDALAAINNAEGSAGKLIYDRQLYDNLTQASNDLTFLLQDMKARPGRYIHFSVFGRKND